MEDDPTPQPAAPQGFLVKAREILDGLKTWRIDPTKIKITEAEPRITSGQSVIAIGTLVPPEEVQSLIPEQLLNKLLNDRVAIKKLGWDLEDAEQSAKFFKHFVSELSIMAALSHPNIVKLIGFVEDIQNGDAWVVLPWEPNGNVREFLQSGEWDIPERISLIQDVANGVEYLHTRQPPICHGDLKSLNILVNSSYRALITDFGSARVKQASAAMNENSPSERPPRDAANDNVNQESTSSTIKLNPATSELVLTGPELSLRWAAPELLDDMAPDLPSDMWAVGWLCWEIATGKIPFEELDSEEAIRTRIEQAIFPAIREEPQLSRALMLCNLISDCWILNPHGRITASVFRRRVGFIPSTAPSGNASDGGKIRSAALLQELGKMYHIQSDMTMAEAHYRAALEVAYQTENHMASANALNSLGQLYSAQSRHREAEEAFRGALDAHSRIGNPAAGANTSGGLGSEYHV